MKKMVNIIAEIGQAHEGSLGIAISYIDALADTGVNAVKFQVHIADAESSIHEPFRIKFSQQDKTRFDPVPDEKVRLRERQSDTA